ncbi:MAG: amidohydrolase family protein [Desulfobacterales bacterium]|nr:amidohydrolase family protein [Desulfobacterales bacterium]
MCDPSPLVNIHAAVTRTRRDGTPAGGWHPDQRVTVEQAVRAYTAMPATLSGAGRELGTFATGKRADLIVLDRNIYAIDPADIVNARVDLTVFDGRVVYER